MLHSQPPQLAAAGQAVQVGRHVLCATPLQAGSCAAEPAMITLARFTMILIVCESSCGSIA
jgi:hypothetical protein